ncbi:MAG: hypothetical protein KAZ18_00270 [Acinetobacter sp.]|nr:hypothetical protein [Acinetobacter sp.]
MKATTKKRKCSSCGGYCGGRKGSCKFAANEEKNRANEIWSMLVGNKGEQNQ